MRQNSGRLALATLVVLSVGWVSLAIGAESSRRLAMNPACSGNISSAVGGCGADFKLNDLQGHPVALSSFRGKVVLLHFWATWCEPCRTELPNLIKLSEQLKGSGIIIVAVSLDNGADEVKKFFKNQLPNFPILLDAGQTVSTMYGTFKVPETYIIDTAGVVRDKTEGSRDWKDPLVKHYLDCLNGGKR